MAEITKEILEKKGQALEQQRRQIMSQLNATEGAILYNNELLANLEAPQIVPTTDSGTSDPE